MGLVYSVRHEIKLRPSKEDTSLPTMPASLQKQTLFSVCHVSTSKFTLDMSKLISKFHHVKDTHEHKDFIFRGFAAR